MKRLLILTLLLFAVGLAIMPSLVLAQAERPSGGGGAFITNPLGSGNNDPRTIVGNVIKAILGLVGSLALAMFIFGGFTWITSAGNDEKVKKGKDMIIWATFGLAVIFASYAIVNFVIEALTGSG